ncbi:inovirus-type Gp2 protein [Mangrovibacter sp. SLW1]
MQDNTIPAREADRVSVISRQLQQAVDHYPRLAALSFSLHGAGGNTVLKPSVMLRFHTAVHRSFGEYVTERRVTGRPSQPTLLRWLWEDRPVLPCRMLLLFNRNAVFHLRDGASPGEALQPVTARLKTAWADASDGGTLSEPVILYVDRTRPDAAEHALTRLREMTGMIASPVSATRSGLVI